MYSIRSSTGGRDRTYRDVAISVVGLLAVGFMLVEHGTISRVVIGVGVPLGFAVASGDRIGSLLALGWAAVPVQVTVTASIPVRIRVWTKYALFGLLVVGLGLVVVALFRPSLEAWHVLNVSFGTLIGITIAELVGV
ncbi:hypothetical protein [Halomontanus rarus]|uniref:hypothetical protein n=1 Tax=Halomontanus rarus TaxID=3034020 RepID=UPI0023E7DDA1|nr:hypothetical protein [Halovivax sp. TS33]